MRAACYADPEMHGPSAAAVVEVEARERRRGAADALHHQARLAYGSARSFF